MTTFFSNLYHNLIVDQLRQLYLYGPAVLGFWAGQSNSQICQSITTYSELFWQSNPQQCIDMIEGKFTAFRKTAEIVMYFFCLFQISRQCGVACLFLWCHRPYRKKQARIRPPYAMQVKPPTFY